MPIPKSDSISCLRLAENHFLEVLLSGFELRSQGEGAHLTVSFNSDTPACWNRAGRKVVRNYLDGFKEKIENLQKDLDDLLVNGRRQELVFKDPDIVFRWASAGTLPIIRLGSEEYYCLFYREIEPIGWNIANGACDSWSELLNPLCALERELCEELIILEPNSNEWCVLERGDPISMDRPEFRAVRQIVSELELSGQWNMREGIKQLQTPLKWFSGPDTATIRATNTFNKQERHSVSACFVNINAEDFGIELDRVIKINVSKDALIFDGEIKNEKRLNRIVGLFKTDRLKPTPGQLEFIPDRCFYGSEKLDGEGFKRVMRDNFIDDLKLAETRESAEIEAWEKCDAKFNLCPVTRRLVQRFARTIPEPRKAKDKFDVFVSYAHEDEKLAVQVANFIKEHFSERVFYYTGTQRDYDFDREIDAALESAQSIVAVGSRLEHLTARWPDYEYRAFHNEMKNGNKPNGKVLSFVVGVDPVEIPLPLRKYVVKSCANESEIPMVLEELVRCLKGNTHEEA
jgi:hypothetical protein